MSPDSPSARSYSRRADAPATPGSISGSGGKTLITAKEMKPYKRDKFEINVMHRGGGYPWIEVLQRTHIGGPARRVAHLPFRKNALVDDDVRRLGSEIMDHSGTVATWREKLGQV